MYQRVVLYLNFILLSVSQVLLIQTERSAQGDHFDILEAVEATTTTTETYLPIYYDYNYSGSSTVQNITKGTPPPTPPPTPRLTPRPPTRPTTTWESKDVAATQQKRKVITKEEIITMANWLYVVKYGEEGEDWMTKDHYLQYLNVTMKERKFGPFTISVIELYDIMNFKDPIDVLTLFQAAYAVIKLRMKEGAYNHFGTYAKDAINYYATLSVVSPKTQEYFLQVMSFVHQVLVSRVVLVNIEIKKALDLADTFYTKLDTKVIFYAIRELLEYPRVTAIKNHPPLNSNELALVIEEAFSRPLKEAASSNNGRALFASVNELIEKSVSPSTRSYHEYGL